MVKLPWEGAHFSFYCNKECEYFPCHPDADPERFNCLFCYCPLYVLGRKCGGDFSYTKDGIKDCTNCLFPHVPENYPDVVGRYGELLKVVRQLDQMAEEKTRKARDARLAREAAKSTANPAASTSTDVPGTAHDGPAAALDETGKARARAGQSERRAAQLAAQAQKGGGPKGNTPERPEDA